VSEKRFDDVAMSAGEYALRESEARFRELADNISQVVWTADNRAGFTGTTSAGISTPGLAPVIRTFRRGLSSAWQLTIDLHRPVA
jgi:hypothetical protein